VNRDGLVRDTYAHFGLAIFKAQVLEHGVVNAMVVARMPDRDRINRRDIDVFIDRQFEHTPGLLLCELKKYTSVPDDVSQILSVLVLCAFLALSVHQLAARSGKLRQLSIGRFSQD
jgi:hypothetical protein